MNRRKKRFVMLLVPLTVILLASFLAAQGPPGPPNPCLNVCWLAYTEAVEACHGNQTCLAAAHNAALKCVNGCNFPPR